MSPTRSRTASASSLTASHQFERRKEKSSPLPDLSYQRGALPAEDLRELRALRFQLLMQR